MLQNWLRPRPESAASGTSLDTRIISFTDNDHFLLRDLLNGGLCILGRTGSGKTSSSGYQFGQAVVSLPGSGGLILASSADDAAFWGRIFARFGRQDDLLRFGPEQPLRFNLIDCERASGADARELTQCFLSIDEVLKRSRRGGAAKNEAFWEGGKERLLYNANVILLKALGTVGAPLVAEFINGAATRPEQIGAPEQDGEAATPEQRRWRQSFHCECLRRADEAPATPAERHDVLQAEDYWLGQYPTMDPEVRSNILADVFNCLHVLNSGEVSQLLSQDTNVSPATLEQGKWVLVDMPVHTKGASGLAVMAAWKYGVQKHLLRRRAGENASPVIIWADEFQNVASSFDSVFLAECRKHYGCMVALTQSLHSFHTAMKDDYQGHQTKALLANFATKIFHVLGDAESAHWASEMVGKAIQIRGTGAKPRPRDKWEDLAGGGPLQFSFTEHMEEILQPNVFLQGLRTGGPPDYCCDAFVIKSGEPFSNGENWLLVSFSQQ